MVNKFYITKEAILCIKNISQRNMIEIQKGEILLYINNPNIIQNSKEPFTTLRKFKYLRLNIYVYIHQYIIKEHLSEHKVTKKMKLLFDSRKNNEET